MTERLEALATVPGFEPVDFRLGEVLARFAISDAFLVCLSAMLVNRNTRQGHVCLELPRYAGRALREVAELGQVPGGSVDVLSSVLLTFVLPDVEGWKAMLVASGAAKVQSSELPLVLDGSRLYLQRYYRHEQVLAGRLLERLGEPRTADRAQSSERAIERWFEGTSEPAKRAADIAVSRRLCVVTGGPGTGKTTTVVRLLGLLSELLSEQTGKDPKILLLAPTGKAAARLSEAIMGARQRLSLSHPAVANLPAESKTIHRALAEREWSEHAERLPFVADLVIVDEASMVDIGLMRELFDASVEVDRLVLLGDPNQLASVQAGAVLGDLCAKATRLRAAIARASGGHAALAGGSSSKRLSDVFVELTESHRFKGDSAIGRLATSIVAGDSERAFQVLAGPDPAVRFIELDGPDLEPLYSEMWRGYADLRAARDPLAALSALGRFRVLCVHRRGRLGVEGCNEHMRSRLARGEPGSISHAFPRPVLVTRSDESGRLYNGDLGVILASPVVDGGLRTTESAKSRTIRSPLSDTLAGASRAWLGGGSEPRAFFRLASGAVHDCMPSRLPEHELAFAMSVHKSQGSETDEVMVVLPEAGSPLLSRELLYTAVTRARAACVIFGTRTSLTQAIETRVVRQTGLADAFDRLASVGPERDGLG